MLSSIRNINLSQIVNHINNPNYQTGTLIEEIPTDFGRAYAGYKRGGILEGAEKFRKEVIAAAIWLFGIPAFNKIGNFVCEKALKIPTNIDYSNEKDGRDSIQQCVDYIKKNTPEEKKAYLKSINCEWMDVSALDKYGENFKNVTVKQVKSAKQITAISAWILNCVLMGIVLPKVNQAITAKKLKEQNNKNFAPKFDSMDEFQKNTKKDNLSFMGSINNLPDTMTYGLENNNKFRLVSTDVPMIIGRIFTARNKYEALEIAFMDTVSIYFYNFCSGHIQDALRKLSSTININPVVADYITSLDNDTLKNAINNLPENKEEIKPTLDLFNGNTDIQRKIYKEATFGKYGKLNKFVKNDELKDIDKTINSLLRKIKDKNIEADPDKIKELIKSTNVKNAGFLACGLGVAILGLAVIVPKLTFLITKLLTGKDEFSGITNYDDKK